MKIFLIAMGIICLITAAIPPHVYPWLDVMLVITGLFDLYMGLTYESEEN